MTGDDMLQLPRLPMPARPARKDDGSQRAGDVHAICFRGELYWLQEYGEIPYGWKLPGRVITRTHQKYAMRTITSTRRQPEEHGETSLSAALAWVMGDPSNNVRYMDVYSARGDNPVMLYDGEIYRLSSGAIVPMPPDAAKHILHKTAGTGVVLMPASSIYRMDAKRRAEAEYAQFNLAREQDRERHRQDMLARLAQQEAQITESKAEWSVRSSDAPEHPAESKE